MFDPCSEAYLDYDSEQSDGWLNVIRQCTGAQKLAIRPGAAGISQDMSSGVDGVRTVTPLLLLFSFLCAATDRSAVFEQAFVSGFENVAERLIAHA